MDSATFNATLEDPIYILQLFWLAKQAGQEFLYGQIHLTIQNFLLACFDTSVRTSLVALVV